MSRNCRKCVICDKNEYGTYKAHMYFTTFPKEESRCREWLKLVGKEELTMLSIKMLHKNRYICKEHFEAKHMNRKGNRVKRTAIPTLNLKWPPLTDFQLHNFDQNVKELRTVPHQTEATSFTMSIKPTERQIEINSVPSSTKCAVELERLQPVPDAIPSTSGHFPGLKQSATNTKTTNKPRAAAQNKRKLENPIDWTPRKKKLLERLQTAKCTIKSLRSSANLIEKLDSPVLKSLVESAHKNQNRVQQGRRWTIQNKISCLAILKRSAKTYKYLRHLMPLPSVKTLQTVLKKLPMHTGINNATLKHLESISESKSEKEKVCCLLFDEIALKRRLIFDSYKNHIVGYEDLGQSDDCRSHKVADHAAVFMLQGVYSKFKQPIALYFVKGTMSSQNLCAKIKEIINSVTSTGYRVIATVCDQGPTNMGAIKLLKEFSGQPTGENWFYINDSKHYIIYDVPHLFKSLRNNFQKNGTIIYDGKTGHWDHLVEVEKLNRDFLYLSKLSENHVNPKYRAKMKVKYAAQTLSNTVSAVLKLVSMNEMSKQNEKKANQLLDTAIIIQELDRLFDITNGPSGPKDKKMGYRQNVSKKTNHLLKWSEYLVKLKTVKFLNKNGCVNTNVKCVQGYMITIQSLCDIWKETSSLGFKYLNLRQLNQDALENLFGIVRQHSSTNKNPTCYHFMIALKTSIISNMTAPHSRGSNCEMDNGRLLTNFHNLIFSEKNPTNKNDSESDIQDINDEINKEIPDIAEEINLDIAEEINYTISIDDTDDDEMIKRIDNTSSQDHAAVYVSGYVASTILKKNKCKQCLTSLCASNEEQDEDNMYIYITLREWWSDTKSLTYPSKSLYSVLKQMIQIMETNVIPELYKLNIGHLTTTLFYAQISTNWFDCPIHKEQIIKYMFEFCANLLIRRQCEIINKQYASQEERLADSVKKAQQFGQGV